MNESMYKSVIGLVSGVLFGSGMVISGMVDPINVLGFLDITGDWNPSLAFVMGGALAIFTPMYHLVIKKRKQAVNGEGFKITTNQVIDKKLVGGAALFGIGWGLAGFCPGPAVTSLGGGATSVILFSITMLIGIKVAVPLQSK